MSSRTRGRFIQLGRVWEVLGRTPGQYDSIVGNVAGHLAAAQGPTRTRTHGIFYKIY